MNKILIVEDDKILNRGVTFALKKEGYEVICAYSKEEGREVILNNKIDFLLLDINLPDGSGLDLCKEIRDTGDFKIVFFTANDTEEDMLKGFENGADDYISKPFSIEVLKRKVNAMLRNKQRDESIFEYKDLKIDFDKMAVYKNNLDISLSVTEYRLLELLVKNKGKVITKEIILDKIGDSRGSFVYENTLAVTIRRLRKKIEDDPSYPTVIKTSWGKGYYSE